MGQTFWFGPVLFITDEFQRKRKRLNTSYGKKKTVISGGDKNLRGNKTLPIPLFMYIIILFSLLSAFLMPILHTFSLLKNLNSRSKGIQI